MKALPWICAGIAVSAAVYVISQQSAPRYSTGSSDVDDAANRASFWGSKQRLGGLGSDIGGRVKQTVGGALGDDQLAGEGVLDRATGAIKDTAGKAAQSIGETVHEVNR